MNKPYNSLIKNILTISLLLSSVFMADSQASSINDSQQYPNEDSVNNELSNALNRALLLRHSNSDSAFILLEKVIDLASKKKDSSTLITAYLRKGILLKITGNLDKANNFFKKAHDVSEKLKDSIGIARVRFNIGQLHKQKGSYDIAIQDIVTAIQIFKIKKKKAFLKTGYSTLASLYLLNKRFDLAIKSYHNLLELSVQDQDSIEIRRAWYNLGISHYYANEYTQSLDFLYKALTSAKKQKNITATVQAHNAIGSVFYVQDLYEQALVEFNTAYLLLDDVEFNTELAKVLNNLAAIYEVKEEWHNALRFYYEAEKLAKITENQNDLSMIYYNLSSVFESLNRSESALYYYKLYDSIQDSLFSINNQKQIIEIQEKYESVKKDQAILMLNKEKEYQRASLEKRNLLLITFGLSSLLLFMLTISYLKKLKVQRSLATKTQELNQQRVMKLIDDNSTKVLNAYLEGETTERKRLAESLHNNLGSQLATANLYYEHIEKNLQDSEQRNQLQKANRLLKMAYTNVRKIAHNLSEDALSDFGLEPAIVNLCQLLSDSGKLKVQYSSVRLEKKLPIQTEQAIFISVQELFTNLVKHANANYVKVVFMEKDDKLHIQIIDDGKGLETSYKKNQEGIGLRTIRKRIEAIKGEFSIQTLLEGGTKAILSVPYSNHNQSNKQLL